jgi:peptidyl-prolyl cis-trans isomerase B (cyclophilin B)
MADPESGRQDKLESSLKILLRKADENRNYVVGAAIAIVLVAGAIYFRTVSVRRLRNEAWAGLSSADSTGMLREKWKKHSGSEAGPFLAQELAVRLFQEQAEKAGKSGKEINDERIVLLDEGIAVLGEALKKHPRHAWVPDLTRLQEGLRAEREWVSQYGARIAAAREPAPMEIHPKPEKLQAARKLEDKAGQNPRVTLKTDRGDIELELFEDDAPNHVANFLALALEGYYDGLVFHRAEDWVIQTGDPEGTGSGGPGHRIALETNTHKHDEGALGMARSEGTDTAGSQFYIVRKPQHEIDGKYTIFGRVLSGLDVVQRIQQNDRVNEIVIDSLRNKEYRPKIIKEGSPSERKTKP